MSYVLAQMEGRYLLIVKDENVDPNDMSAKGYVLDRQTGVRSRETPVPLILGRGYAWEEADDYVVAEYSPDQPRAPEGTPEGGQWVSADATRRERALQVFEEYVATAPIPRRREEATALNYIQNGTGMAAPPTIVSKSELETMGMNDEVIVLYRGESDVAYIRQWQQGPLYTGEGVYGSGTYTATNIEDALHYADGDKQRIHMIGLPKSARIVDHDAILPEIRAKYHNRVEILRARQRTMESEGLSDDEINNRLMKLTQQYRDVGIYAALQGYDAIRYASEGESGAYIVILNRSICYVVENYE